MDQSMMGPKMPADPMSSQAAHDRRNLELDRKQAMLDRLRADLEQSNQQLHHLERDREETDAAFAVAINAAQRRIMAANAALEHLDEDREVEVPKPVYDRSERSVG